MDKILVSKCGGILSTTLIYSLLENKNNLVFAPNIYNNNTFSNLSGLLKNERFSIIDSNYQNIQTVDYIFYLDCLDYENYFDNKYSYLIHQIENIKNLLSYSSQTGAKLLITLPFCDYQNYNKDLFEYFNLIKLIYDLVNCYIYEYKINVQFVRVSDIYGQNSASNSNNYISNLIFNALNNSDIEIFNRKKYLTFALDVAKILIKIMSNIKTDEIIDVLNPKLYLDFDIVKLIINSTKSKSRIVVKNPTPIEPNYLPNLSYLKNENMNSFVSIEEGLEKTIEFIKLMYFT